MKAALAGHGLLSARLVGWAGAGKAALAGIPAEVEVDLPEVTDLTAGDLARIGRELTGVEVLVWAVRPDERDVLAAEKTRYL